jgi:regulatory protein YycI of two-component signal transduction system YycFG
MHEIYMVPLPGDLEKEANLKTVFNLAKAPFVGMGKNLSPRLEKYVSKHIHKGTGYERGRYNQLTGLSPSQQTVKNLP